MLIVRHQSFLDSVLELVPNISWLSAIVPKMLEGHEREGLVDTALKDLALKVNQLTGEVLDQDTQATEVETGTVLMVNDDQLTVVEAPAVVIVAKDTSLESLQGIEERLRAALADIIVARAEAQGIVPEEIGAVDEVFSRHNATSELDQSVLESFGLGKPRLQDDCAGCPEAR